MRAVFFLQGERVPAARARGYTIVRALEGEGIACDLRVPRPSVYGDTRLPWPWHRARGVFRPLAVFARLRQLAGLRPDDVVVFQRPMIEYPTALLERLAARGRRAVFDFDDAIYFDFGGQRKLRAITGMVDHVIAGNRTLAEAAGVPAKTTVIPTVVDTDRFRPQPAGDRRGADVVVGWTGLRGNYRQLVTARHGIERALRRTGARLLLISNAPPPAELEALRPEYVPWREATELEDLARIDVGLMPLPDTPFARGKCAYKLIQYMALGRPGVASPVGTNAEVVTNGVDGFLAADDDAWENAIVRLVEDPALRQSMGAAARARIEGAYSVRAVLPRYLDVLERVGYKRARGKAP